MTSSFIDDLVIEDFSFLAISEKKILDQIEKHISSNDLKVDKNHAFMAVSAILGSRRLKFPELLDGSFKSVSLAINKNATSLRFGPSYSPYVV